MVKPKKGKKADDHDTMSESESSGEEQPTSAPSARPPNNRRNNKKRGSDSGSDSGGGGSQPLAPSKPGFALLMQDDGDDDDDDDDVVVAVSDEEDSDLPIVVQKTKAGAVKGGKKGKKGKKKKEEDDEDIDAVLAELQLEYSGQAPAPTPAASDQPQPFLDKKEAKKAKQKEKKKAGATETEMIVEAEEDAADPVTTSSTSAAQKKKDKKKDKKRDKREETPEAEGEAALEDEDEGEDKKGKKKKKGAKDEKGGKDVKGPGPGKKTILAMQEALKKIKEEEERLKLEEEERERQEEEEQRRREEAARAEKERKEKKKQKEKERKERMKAEGRLLTAKQKQDKARAQELINSLRAQGLELPERPERTPRPGTRLKPNKKPPPPPTEEEGVAAAVKEVEVVIVDEAATSTTDPTVEDVKDEWDADSGDDDHLTAQPATHDTAPPAADVTDSTTTHVVPVKEEEDETESSDSSSGEEEESDEEEEENEEQEDQHTSLAERKRHRALARIQKRKDEAEKLRSLDELRAAVVCVLGHVDTGKTKILDKLRRTNVQVGEAGGITQQIGATNVPIENIKDNCKLVKGFSEMELKLPGLLIIDTPGHESFSNLRSRGSSLCDIAILVVDIMHGLEPQTVESINLLKSRKTPFIVALNKIDRLYDWQTMGRKDVRDIIKAQAENTQREFEERTKQVVVEFAEQGLNAALYYENPDVRSYVSLVPTSAITGEGMGNLLALIVESCQTKLARRLMYSQLLQATVLEVKMIPGLGTTIDCILINGKLAEGDTIILAGTDGPLVTQIRSLLMPQPMKELRVKNAYIEYKEIKAAQGVKIAAKDLEKAIAGLNLQVAEQPDEVEVWCEEVGRELKTALSSIKLKERGVYVQASTLGSLEALLEFLRTSKIPVSGIRIGPVVKKDVMKASIMLEHESQYATILAFDVKIERDAQELADSLGVKVFQADIIYHLFDRFMEYREQLKQKKREEFKNIAVFPCKIRILPNFIFNSRDPIVMGVIIEAGILKEGTPICVPSKEFLFVGTVSSIEANHKQVEVARKGMEVCIKIENTTGEAPKMFGRHFDHTDTLTSRISRASIDACKDYFRDDLSKTDWQLMVELKKLFQIM